MCGGRRVEAARGGGVDTRARVISRVHARRAGAPRAEAEGKVPEVALGLEDMLLVKDRLCRAEDARRQGRTADVYAAYHELACFYGGRADSKTGVYFHEKCLEIARVTGDGAGEMDANADLGAAHFELRDNVGAIRCVRRGIVLRLSRVLVCLCLYVLRAPTPRSHAARA